MRDLDTAALFLDSRPVVPFFGVRPQGRMFGRNSAAIAACDKLMRQSRQPTGAFIVIVALALAAGCAGLLVDARVHTLAGIQPDCRVSEKRPGPNLLQLDVKVTSSCTSGDIATQVFLAGKAISTIGKSSKVIYEDTPDDITTEAFPLPPAGSWLTVDVTAICDRGGVKRSGRNDCQIVK